MEAKDGKDDGGSRVFREDESARGASGRALLRLCITAVVLDIVSVWRHMFPRRDDSSDVLSDDQLEEESDGGVYESARFGVAGCAAGTSTSQICGGASSGRSTSSSKRLLRCGSLEALRNRRFWRGVRRFPFVNRQVIKGIDEAVKLIPQERKERCTVKHGVDVSVPHATKENDEVVKLNPQGCQCIGRRNVEHGADVSVRPSRGRSR